jgi:WD40 repeat protein
MTKPLPGLLLASLLLVGPFDATVPLQTPGPVAHAVPLPKPPILWTADYSPDGKFYAVGGTDRQLRIYDGKTNQVLTTYPLSATIQGLDWDPAGKWLAVALDHEPARLLDVATGQFMALPEVTGTRTLAWNPAGTLLAVGDYEGLLHLYDRQGKWLRTIKKENTKGFLSLDWHPTKDILLTGSDRIRVFDAQGKVLLNQKHREEETIILAVKWHPGGTFFATGDYGHKEEGIESVLQYWQADGTLLHTLRGSKAEYRNIRWNKEGTLLATASDGLRLWSAKGQLQASGQTPDLLWGLDWHPQRTTLVTSSMQGRILLWNNQAQIIKTIP